MEGGTYTNYASDKTGRLLTLEGKQKGGQDRTNNHSAHMAMHTVTTELTKMMLAIWRCGDYVYDGAGDGEED